MAQDKYRHAAIYALHDNVAYIRGDENGVKAYDASDQEVAYDSAAVETKATQVEVDEKLAALRVERETRGWSRQTIGMRQTRLRCLKLRSTTGRLCAMSLPAPPALMM